MISFDYYQERTRETIVYPKEHAVAYTMLGLANEAGEALGKYKKVLRGDRQLTGETRQDILDECGDVLYYLARVVDELGGDLGDVAARNVAKLADRAERGVLKGDGDKR